MKQRIEERIETLSQEIQDLNQEREAMYKRNREIEIRIHQLVGAIYELQLLITSQGYQRPETSEQQQGSVPLTQEETVSVDQMIAEEKAAEAQHHQEMIRRLETYAPSTMLHRHKTDSEPE
jgi:chromosome segregation ATPase